MPSRRTKELLIVHLHEPEALPAHLRFQLRPARQPSLRSERNPEAESLQRSSPKWGDCGPALGVEYRRQWTLRLASFGGQLKHRVDRPVDRTGDGPRPCTAAVRHASDWSASGDTQETRLRSS